uniref:Uncharacterized protein n=1 Tax=Rhizophora mucronata TaxID=61149 RepID=A0A2P2NCD4_RHIMU
MKFPCLVELI